MDALQKFFDSLFEAQRKNGGEACKGEEICAVTGPLRDKSRPVEEICRSCSLLPTKPGNVPASITPLVIQAYRIEALAESGASPTYPDFFTPVEWEAFLVLKYSRSKDQEKSYAKPSKNQQSQAGAQAALEARLQRKS